MKLIIVLHIFISHRFPAYIIILYSLIVCLLDDVITVSGHTLSVIYDPPHLIKGVRNNFLTKKMKFNGNISKWSDIVEVYKADCNHAQMRLLHKLNDEHVIPDKIKKMKVCTSIYI